MLQKDHCLNCQNHFMKIRPLLKATFISRRFIKDVKGEEKAKSFVSDILDCSNVDYYELHKFEENIDGYLIFRSKKEGTHIVYCVDREMQLFFLRAFRNYRDYERFLRDKRGIRRLVSHAFNERENEI
jgi:hypothetical protein